MDTERYNGCNFIELFDSGYQFSERELDVLVFDKEIIAQVEGDRGRWTRSVQTIFVDEGRYFSICWERGLTECQDSEFFCQPEEVCRVERTVTKTVIDWVPIHKEET